LSESRISQYLAYHKASAAIGDIDPGQAMLRYLVERYELNVEQRYYLAFLYAQSYCGATAFYHYNEWPDLENIDFNRMERWWLARGREESLFQTDRRWPRSRNQVVDSFRSYSALLCGKTQHEHFSQFNQPTPEERYNAILLWAKNIYTFGQFALFLYIEALHTTTLLDLCPTDLDLEKAWSCRYGLYFAYGLDDLVHDKQSYMEAPELTAEKWTELKSTVAQLEQPPTIWSTETLLCAFRKYHRGKRYIGFYLDRQAVEIAKMQNSVRSGIHWDVLWQYRRETYDAQWLAEVDGHVDAKGLSPEWRDFQWSRTHRILEEA